MIRYENGKLTFEPGDTVAEFRAWLQEQSDRDAWSLLNASICMDNVIRTLKTMEINRNMDPGILEYGLDCDDKRIKDLKLSEIFNGCAGVGIIVENDGSIQEKLPIQVYYEVTSGPQANGYRNFIYVGKKYFDKYHEFDEASNLDADMDSYNYQFEIGGALYACDCDMATEEIWGALDMDRTIREMREKGFELIEHPIFRAGD